MAEQRTKDMTQGKILPLILSFSVPLLLGNLFQQTYNIVDTAIVGQTLGSEALAAVGSSTSVQFLVMGFCQGLCLGFNIPIGQRFGAHDEKGMHGFEYCGSLMAAGFAIAITLITALSCHAILSALQVPSEIMDDAWHYLFIIFLEIPFTIMYNWLAGMMRAIGDSRTPFLFLAIASVLNIGLDFLFILSFHMGVSGAAAATVLSQAVSAFLCLFSVTHSFPILKIAKEERRFDHQEAEELLSMGIPMGLQWSIVAIGSMVMQGANNALGTKYVSAFTAGAKIKQFVLCPFDALATAVSTFVSQNYGARKTDRIHAGIRRGAAAGGDIRSLCGNCDDNGRKKIMSAVSGCRKHGRAGSGGHVFKKNGILFLGARHPECIPHEHTGTRLCQTCHGGRGAGDGRQDICVAGVCEGLRL